VQLGQLALRTSLLVELDRLTEEIAAREFGEPYSGPSPTTVARQDAARMLSELAELHKDDDLSDDPVVARLLDSLDSATALVRILQGTAEPAG
jgi:hypothetical protein